MLRIAAVVGSTRPGRKAGAVARWVHESSRSREDAVVEVVDLADYALPLLDEPVPPMAADYRQPHTRAWADTVASYDAFVFVTPEYNHAPSAALKNALDFLYAEWNDKAAGIVSYGVDGGIRAAEQLRLVLAELRIATVRNQVALSFDTDFRDWTELAPRDTTHTALAAMLDEVVAWGTALRTVRRPLVG